MAITTRPLYYLDANIFIYTAEKRPEFAAYLNALLTVTKVYHE